MKGILVETRLMRSIVTEHWKRISGSQTKAFKRFFISCQINHLNLWAHAEPHDESERTMRRSWDIIIISISNINTNTTRSQDWETPDWLMRSGMRVTMTVNSTMHQLERLDQARYDYRCNMWLNHAIISVLSRNTMINWCRAGKYKLNIHNDFAGESNIVNEGYFSIIEILV